MLRLEADRIKIDSDSQGPVCFCFFATGFSRRGMRWGGVHVQEKSLLSLAYGAAFTGGSGAVAFADLDALAPELRAGDAWLRENAA